MNFFHLFITISLLLITSPQNHVDGKTDFINTGKTIISDPGGKREEYIPWENERRLSWDDYLCEPKRNTDAVASTSTSLGIAYQVINSKFTYHITCDFSKTKSWGLLRTDYILLHEQGHFDITEIFARKLYEALQHYEFNRRTFKRDVNSIYQSIVSEKEEFQQMYDGESDHSRNRKSQYEWLDKIQVMLDETQPYSNYP
jgi:hypothetical protein